MAGLIPWTGDTDLATAASVAGTQTVAHAPLEEGTVTASSRMHAWQTSLYQQDKDDMGISPIAGLYPRARAGAPWADMTPRVLAQTAPESENREKSRRNTSRKGRNRKERNSFYLPWPLTLQTRASSAQSVLGQAYGPAALSSANSRQPDERDAIREEGETGEEMKTPFLTQPWQAWASDLPQQTSADKSAREWASWAVNKTVDAKQKVSHKGRKKTSKKSPWPLTVQAWASFTVPAQAQIAQARSSEVNYDQVGGGPRSKAEGDQRSVLALYQHAQASSSCPATAPGQASSEGKFLDTGSAENTRAKDRIKKSDRKDRKGSKRPWPLTVQAWASFSVPEPEPAGTLLQDQSSAASMGASLGQIPWSQLDDSEEINRDH